MRKDSNPCDIFFARSKSGRKSSLFTLYSPCICLTSKFGIALDAQGANLVRLRVIERRDEPVVFGDIVGHAADIFFQLGDKFAAVHRE